MPQQKRKRFLKTKSSGVRKTDSSKKGSRNPLVEGISGLRDCHHYFHGPERSERPLNFDRATAENGMPSERAFGTFPRELDVRPFSAKSLRLRDIGMDQVSRSSSSLLRREVNNSGIAAEGLMSENHRASKKLLSVLTGTEKLSKHRMVYRIPAPRVLHPAGETARFSQAKKLMLFQTLSKVALPFLDLHVRFGVSKQTVRSFVRRGLVTEVWGPKAVGVRFKLSKKGKNQLKELEAAAHYDSKISRKDMIRLRRATF
jgi:hypothetical protein